MRLTVMAAAIATLAPAAVHAADAVTTGSLDVSTSDGRGTITIDGKNAGEGSFHGDIIVGEHEIVVLREGFRRYKKTVVVEAGKSFALAVSLTRLEAAAPPPEPPPLFKGLYGGFFLGPSLEPFGSASTFSESCSLIGATSCDASAPTGVVLAGNIGYTWDPVGIELFFGGSVDYATPTASFNGVVGPGSNAALTGPARTESFQILRAGGMGAIRARATIDGKRFRGSFAIGPGFAYRAFVMNRTADTIASSDPNAISMPGLSDAYSPSTVTYLAPALSLEAALHIRLTTVTALTLGLSTWIENAGTGSNTDADLQHTIYGTPLRTPSYRLAAGAQFYMWPFIGLQFGP